jgi:hypothetical protein
MVHPKEGVQAAAQLGKAAWNIFIDAPGKACGTAAGYIRLWAAEPTSPRAIVKATSSTGVAVVSVVPTLKAASVAGKGLAAVASASAERVGQSAGPLVAESSLPKPTSSVPEFVAGEPPPAPKPMLGASRVGRIPSEPLPTTWADVKGAIQGGQNPWNTVATIEEETARREAAKKLLTMPESIAGKAARQDALKFIESEMKTLSPAQAENFAKTLPKDLQPAARGWMPTAESMAATERQREVNALMSELRQARGLGNSGPGDKAAVARKFLQDLRTRPNNPPPPEVMKSLEDAAAKEGLTQP